MTRAARVVQPGTKLGAVLLAASLGAGCSSRGPAHEQATSAPRAAPQPAAAPAAARDDGAGELVPSGQRASWLELPRGFRELPGSSPRLWAYQANGIPLAKVRAYLAARLSSEHVEYPAGGVTFHAARPTYTQLSLPALDVRLLESRAVHAELGLWVEELPEAVPPLPVDVASKELARTRNRLE